MDDGVHYLNLTRGLLCSHHVDQPRYLRLQSTWCEQKRWADILWTIGPDFYQHLAAGPVTVHDVSERPRATRACWQGLAWVRYACERLWSAPTTPAIVRNGHDMTAYFDRQLDNLDDRVKKHVRYFWQFHRGQALRVSVCTGLESTR
ncbi:hypothetical protein [Nonomuraea sp. NPDC050786]|uniref:hypothetical protein n=1 Tax=Nonomuraea sp. NPDC050786 TaxID=3154840 RepID=UPI0033C3ABBB